MEDLHEQAGGGGMKRESLLRSARQNLTEIKPGVFQLCDSDDPASVMIIDGPNMLCIKSGGQSVRLTEKEIYHLAWLLCDSVGLEFCYEII